MPGSQQTGSQVRQRCSKRCLAPAVWDGTSHSRPIQPPAAGSPARSGGAAHRGKSRSEGMRASWRTKQAVPAQLPAVQRTLVTGSWLGNGMPARPHHTTHRSVSMGQSRLAGSVPVSPGLPPSSSTRSPSSDPGSSQSGGKAGPARRLPLAISSCTCSQGGRYAGGVLSCASPEPAAAPRDSQRPTRLHSSCCHGSCCSVVAADGRSQQQGQRGMLAVGHPPRMLPSRLAASRPAGCLAAALQQREAPQRRGAAALRQNTADACQPQALLHGNAPPPAACQ